MAVAIAYTGIICNGASYAAASGSSQYPIDKDTISVDCTLTLSGSYGTASSHGDTLDFTAVAPPIGASLYGNPPSDWTFKELVVAGAAATGFQYNYCPGPTLATPTQAGGVLQIFGGAAGSGQGGVEITQGSAYSSYTPTLAGTVIKARFVFARS